MEWNNGKERALFEREQARLRKEYLAAGMTEEQIKKMREFDEGWFRSRRREANHTQQLEIQTSEDEDEIMENQLYKKSLKKISIEDGYSEYSRYGWIEEIENENLLLAINSLSDKDKELLTKYIFEGLKQTEIAQTEGVVKVVICKKLKRIKNFLKKY